MRSQRSVSQFGKQLRPSAADCHLRAMRVMNFWHELLRWSPVYRRWMEYTLVYSINRRNLLHIHTILGPVWSSITVTRLQNRRHSCNGCEKVSIHGLLHYYSHVSILKDFFFFLHFPTFASTLSLILVLSTDTSPLYTFIILIISMDNMWITTHRSASMFALLMPLLIWETWVLRPRSSSSSPLCYLFHFLLWLRQ